MSSSPNYREKLLKTINQAAEVLLTSNDSDILQTLLEGMKIVGECLDVDRVQIWRNEIIDGELHFVMRYEWLSEVGKQKIEVPIGLHFPYSNVPEWLEMFNKGEAINSPISKLPPRDAAFLGYYEMVSIVCLPLFSNQEFIGFFSVDDCRVEKTYTKDEMNMMASVGLMFTSVFNKVLHEQEIHDTQKFMETLFDASPLFVEVSDEFLNFIDCNDKICDLLSIPNKYEYLNNFEKYNPPTQPCGTPSDIFEKEQSKTAFELGFLVYEWVLIDSKGEEIPLEVTAMRTMRHGKPVLVCYCYDLRQRRLYEAQEREREAFEIKKAALSAEESNRAKSRFLARMSHEIRTPITAVMGISEVQLRGQTMPPDIEESFMKIYDSSKILLNIVNDILDFSKIESGKMTIIESEYDVASLARDVSQLHLVYLDNKDIAFKLHVDKNLPLKLIGDSLRIRQIITNLLTNAFKYTESGSISLSLNRRDGKKKNTTVLSISVKDTGIGMTKAQIDEIIVANAEYVRLHEHERPYVSGTGLGLPIVYSMVQMMNAKIDLQSEVNQGTNITVCITQKNSGAEILGEELATKLENFETGIWSVSEDFNFTPEQMPHGRVLVVDDVDTNLYVAEAMLSSFGLNIELCESGQEAIGKIARGKTYDIIFLDHMMPGMDGIEVIKILHEMGYANPIIALTANAIKGQAKMFMENGFSGFMSKPIDIKILNSYLVRFVKEKDAES